MHRRSVAKYTRHHFFDTNDIVERGLKVSGWVAPPCGLFALSTANRWFPVGAVLVRSALRCEAQKNNDWT